MASADVWRLLVIISPENRAVFPEQLRHRRRGGRPRGGPVVPTSVKLPAPVFDALCAQAHRDGTSLHATMLKALETYTHLDSGVRP